MNEKEDSSNFSNSEDNIQNIRRPFLKTQDNKKIATNLFNNSNDSIINNTNNDIIEEDEDIDEENIFEKEIGEQNLHTPVNETHRLFTSNNILEKPFINSLPLKRILIPKSKLPIIKNNEIIRNKNESTINNDTIRKNLSIENEIFSSSNGFLHCRNCMLIVAINRYGKYSFNK